MQQPAPALPAVSGDVSRAPARETASRTPDLGLSRAARFVKRTFDIVLAGAMLVAVAPLIGVIALLVRLDGRGPVLCATGRAGRDGAVFDMWRFRTRVVGADAALAQLYAITRAASGLPAGGVDPETTRFGRWLRDSSLDQLPQLLNVLRGDMSIVGPRPRWVGEDRELVQPPRLRLTPGMTGPWQMRGPSGFALDARDLDDAYVTRWTLWTDVRILLRTVAWLAGRRRL